MSTTTSITTLDLQQLALVLKNFEGTLVKEEDTTLVLYRNSIATMQAQIKELAAKNRDLSTDIVTLGSQKHELETLHKAEISALEEKVKASEASVESMRKEMQDTMQKAHEMVRAALAEKEAAVKAAVQTGAARERAAREEEQAKARASEAQIRAQHAEQLRKIREKVDAIAAFLDGTVNTFREIEKARSQGRLQILDNEVRYSKELPGGRRANCQVSIRKGEMPSEAIQRWANSYINEIKNVAA